MHVANQYPKYNPYAVCTKSVYGSAGKKRKGVVKCSETYKFEDFKTEELKAYAKMGKKASAYDIDKMDRDELIRALYRYVASEKGKEVWQTFLGRYRKEHPELTFRDAVKRASKEYHSGKKGIFEGSS